MTDEELLRKALEALKALVPEHVVCECDEGDESNWCFGATTIAKLEERLLNE